MAIQERLYTANEFWGIGQKLDGELRLELTEGAIYEMLPSSAIPTIVALNIGRFFDD